MSKSDKPSSGRGVPTVLVDVSRDAIEAHHRRTEQGTRILSAKELRDIFAEFSTVKVSEAKMELQIRFPWDPELQDAVRAIPGSRFEPRGKVWHVRLSAWQQVLELAPRIQRAKDRAWDDCFIESVHLDGDDLRIVIPDSRRDRYPVNALAMFEGAPYLISHVGRPYLQAGEPVCNVYLILDDGSAQDQLIIEPPAAPRQSRTRAGAEDADVVGGATGAPVARLAPPSSAAPRSPGRGETAIDVNSDDVSF